MMFKITIFPTKCVKGYLWMAKYKDGEVIEISDTTYHQHEKHGCMQPLQHYHWITIEKKACPTCGKWTITRRKEVV